MVAAWYNGYTMSIIPLPQRGQPLDVTYIYQIASTVNDLSTKIASTTKNYSSINNGVTNPQNVTYAETKFVASSVAVTSAGVDSNNQKAFSYTFPSEFKYSPVVTATVVNTGSNSSGISATVVLTSITTSRVDGLVKFSGTGSLSLNVHLIAIGVAN